MKKLVDLLVRYREVVLYVFFGGMTTVIDWCVSFGLYAINVNVHVANTLAWCIAVLFAFVTNRIFVFESKTRGARAVTRELVVFSGGRVVTLLLQELLVFLFFDLIGWNKYAVKILAAIVVIVLNYFISKLLVFRKKT